MAIHLCLPIVEVNGRFTPNDPGWNTDPHNQLDECHGDVTRARHSLAPEVFRMRFFSCGQVPAITVPSDRCHCAARMSGVETKDIRLATRPGSLSSAREAVMTFPTWSLFLFPILAIILITMFRRFKHLLLLTDRQERGRRRWLYEICDDSIGSTRFALKRKLVVARRQCS
jgi:hypothetical protein